MTEFLTAKISPRLIERVAWCALLTGIPFVAVDVVCGNWDHDGGFYLQRGWYITKGLQPYVDYGSIYPPLGDILTSFAIRTGLGHTVLAIALPIAWVLATMLVTALLIFEGTRDRALAALAASLVPLWSAQNGGNHLTLEHCVAVFSALAFVPLVRDAALTPAAAARAMLFAVAAALCKQTGAVAVFVVLVAMFERRRELTRRHIAAIACAAIALPLAILIWLDFNVARIYANVFAQLGRYTGESGGKSYAVIAREFTRAPETAWLLVVGIIAGLVAAFLLPRQRLLALAATAGIVIEFYPRVLRDYSHYNLNIWPFLALVLALTLTIDRATAATALRVVLLLFAVVMNASLLFGGRWTSPSPLITAFHPAARVVSAVTPDDALVRQYGTPEPIIEFLAYRREEMIERPWGDPAFEYPNPPHPSTTIVVIGRVQDVQLRERLERYGFVVISQLRVDRAVTILRHRSALPLRPRSAETRTPAPPGS